MTQGTLSILHILSPGTFGGLERVVHGLASGTAARGHSVTVALLVPPGIEDHPLAQDRRAVPCTRHHDAEP